MTPFDWLRTSGRYEQKPTTDPDAPMSRQEWATMYRAATEPKITPEEVIAMELARLNTNIERYLDFQRIPKSVPDPDPEFKTVISQSPSDEELAIAEYARGLRE